MPSWSKIPYHLYRILIIGCSESEKTNAVPNLINHQPDIDEIYAKDEQKIFTKLKNVFQMKTSL